MIDLAKSIHEAIERSLRSVSDEQASSSRAVSLDGIIDEMSRNAAHAVVNLLETLEREDACPVCGTDPAQAMLDRGPEIERRDRGRP